ncbi:FkbM family methyltransferase [Myxococcota bacterium]
MMRTPARNPLINLGFRSVARRLVDSLFSRDLSYVVPFGKENVWNINTRALGQDSVVVSAGVGKDFSFERELVEYFGCRVYLYDPSPTGLATIERDRDKLKNISFFPVGISEKTGSVCFGYPERSLEGSYRTPRQGAPTAEFECKRLPDVLAENGESRIDLLKLDIEGFEYGVLADMIGSGIKPDQLCIEFHHFSEGYSLRQTIQTLLQLLRSGYYLAYKERCNYTLVREQTSNQPHSPNQQLPIGGAEAAG